MWYPCFIPIKSENNRRCMLTTNHYLPFYRQPNVISELWLIWYKCHTAYTVMNCLSCCHCHLWTVLLATSLIIETSFFGTYMHKYGPTYVCTWNIRSIRHNCVKWQPCFLFYYNCLTCLHSWSVELSCHIHMCFETRSKHTEMTRATVT